MRGWLHCTGQSLPAEVSLPEWPSGVLADKQGSNNKLCDTLGNWELATMGREASRDKDSASVSEECLSFTHCPFNSFSHCVKSLQKQDHSLMCRKGELGTLNVQA